MKIVYIVASVLSAITIIYLVDKNKKLQNSLDAALKRVQFQVPPPSQQ